MQKKEAIAAISTPLAPGGIGIVRISGPEAIAVAEQVFQAASRRPVAAMKGYTCAYGKILQGNEELDEAVLTLYRAPKSYTGEDVVELSCHGGVYVMKRVLQTVLDAGAQLAQPGEFTKRAFLNGKLGLTQAESVMDVIQAGSQQAARAALRGREGVLQKKIEEMGERLLALAGHLAAWIDYPEEDIKQLEPEQLKQSLQDLKNQLEELLHSYQKGKMVREGISVAIVGRPNVGKSTLMNLLAGYQRSIVTNIPGTTRDVVEDTIQIGGYSLHLADTAGMRKTEDLVESMGVELSKQRIEQSDLILAVFDSSDELLEEDRALLESLKGKHVIALLNKSDLESKADWRQIQEAVGNCMILSAKEGKGLPELEKRILELLQLQKLDNTVGLLANERQRDCVRRAVAALQEAIQAVTVTTDAVSVCVDEALEAILELSGKRVSEAVVDNVFSRFCVGK